jgi:hypothetical protein
MRTTMTSAGFLSLALLVLGPSTAGEVYAQTPASTSPTSQPGAPAQGGVLALTEISVKPEMMGEFQSFMKDTMAAMRKGGAKRVEVWQSTPAAGSPFDYAIVVHLDNLAAFDSPGFVEKGLGAAGFSEWQAKAGRLVASVKRSILRTRPDMSIEPAAPPKIAVVTWTTVAAGRGSEYEAWVKNEFLPVVKRGSGASHLVAQTLFGGDANRYVSLTPRDSFTDLDKGPVAVQVLGPEGNRTMMQKVPAGAIAHVERSLIRFVPELSIAPTPGETGR